MDTHIQTHTLLWLQQLKCMHERGALERLCHCMCQVPQHSGDTDRKQTHMLAVSPKKDKSYETKCVLCNLIYIEPCCQEPRTFCFSHWLKYMFQHTQTHIHWAQLEVYVCWGQAKGSSMKGPIYKARLGDARSRSVCPCVCTSQPGLYVGDTTVTNLLYTVTSVGVSVCLPCRPGGSCCSSLSDHLSLKS